MLKFLAGLLRRGRPDPPRPLRGSPRIRREKVYAADSGYVYHYTYEGYRAGEQEGLEGLEFVFHCTSDRASRFAVTVFAPSESFGDWERRFERELNEVERYAIVKMRLFEIFDEFERISDDFEDVLTAGQVERQVEALDL